MLYLVATPIGNLSDFTLRAIETLSSSDYILCENPRHSQILLNYFGIKKPLKAYHKFNEAKLQNKILGDLKNGKQISLISDAGTPGISDPGHRLIVSCQKENLPFSALPGACSIIVALTLSGFECDRFQFVGFLPKKLSLLKQELIEALEYSGTTICFESPKRLSATLKIVDSLANERQICIARELTKLHEECLRGTAKTLLNHFDKHPVKGEMILLISGKKGTQDFSSLTPQEHVQKLQKEFNISKKEAIKMVASLRGVPKKEIYY